MTYADKKPTTPGWYWMKKGQNQWIDEVTLADGLLVIFNDDRCTEEYTRIDRLDVDQFAGPIPEPVEESAILPSTVGSLRQLIAEWPDSLPLLVGLKNQGTCEFESVDLSYGEDGKLRGEITGNDCGT